MISYISTFLEQNMFKNKKHPEKIGCFHFHYHIKNSTRKRVVFNLKTCTRILPST